MSTWKWCVAAGLSAGLVAASPPAEAKRGGRSVVQRGEYLVTIAGCNDCHTPWKMGPNGPAPDTSRLLSGHPEAVVVEAMPSAPAEPWMATATGTFTAWAGPWGVSFAANLTPDPETGIGKWTKQNFIEAMRTGRHMGRGRPILPPMPWPNIAKMTDDDLEAAFAYLKSVPPIRNRVPDPIPPEVTAQGSPPAGEQPAAAPQRGGPAAAPEGTK